MYILLPHVMLFTSTLIMSTIAVITASTFLIMWSSLELNLMSLIPLMLMTNNKLESEAAVKYFLAQALGSGLFLISYLTLTQNLNFITTQEVSSTLMALALMIKLGAAPAHFWFPSVMSNSSWPICVLLATWQKVAPLTMISLMFIPSAKVIFIIAAMSALTGGILGLNQTQLTTLLAYSSIGHLGWVLSLIPNTAYLAMLYFFIYAITTGSLMSLLYLINMYSIKQSSMKHMISPDKLFIPMILLLSLGGLPPLFGFIPKLMALNLLSSQMQAPLAMILIIGSTLNLSYYLALMFNFYITSTNPMTIKSLTQPNLLTPSMILTLPLFMAPLMI